MASSSSTTPEFFSVFLPEFCSDQLKISSNFKSHLRREVGGEVSIKRCGTTKKWNVELIEDEHEEFWFKNGWNTFVTQNHVTIGEFMVFQYHGNSRFTVKIYGTNGLERVYVADEEVVEEEMVGFSSGRRPKKRNEVVMAARRYMLQLKDTYSFMVCMTESYIRLGMMHLPNALVNRCMNGKPSHLTLEIAEQTWRVKVYKFRNDKTRLPYYKLRQGFGHFLIDNGVQVGDVCVFEASDSSFTTLKVSILRIIE